MMCIEQHLTLFLANIASAICSSCGRALVMFLITDLWFKWQKLLAIQQLCENKKKTKRECDKIAQRI